MLDAEILAILRCPITGEMLHQENGRLITESRTHAYTLANNAIPLFAEDFCSKEAEIQKRHYDRIAEAYLANLGYPHTVTYMEYLDQALLDMVGPAPLGVVAELCCGRAEGLELFKEKYRKGLGLDISVAMLQAAMESHSNQKITFIQGDATCLPIGSNTIDTVLMLGGVHHVNNRLGLFQEISRVLRPGGRFIWREPANDLWLWRALRNVIYRISPTLDHETEHPLRRVETEKELIAADLTPECWNTYGFLGFCLFMNSDILVANRAFRFIPGIRNLVRAFVSLDEITRHIPGLHAKGLQAVGFARKLGS